MRVCQRDRVSVSVSVIVSECKCERDWQTSVKEADRKIGFIFVKFVKYIPQDKRVTARLSS